MHTLGLSGLSSKIRLFLIEDKVYRSSRCEDSTAMLIRNTKLTQVMQWTATKCDGKAVNFSMYIPGRLSVAFEEKKSYAPSFSNRLWSLILRIYIVIGVEILTLCVAMDGRLYTNDS